MAGSSIIKLEQIRMEVGANGDIAPVLANGGSELLPFLSVCNQVQIAILDGGPIVQTMGWKWNRVYAIPFFTNSWQQDYAANNLNISWLERCKAYDYNNTSVPKPDIDVMARRDLVDTFRQFWGPVTICWLYNNQLQYGVWGGQALANLHGLSNPGVGVVYTNPVGATGVVNNPITQVQDAFGNFWVLTTFGTCGSSNPFATNLNPVYPTLASPTTVATTVDDGTCVWSAVNPMGQGYRISPTPPQTGRVWYVTPIAQAKPQLYTSFEQYITPIPDEFYGYFLDGVTAKLYQKSNDPKIRAKGQALWVEWMRSLDNSCRKGNLEPDDFMFLPPAQIMAPIGGGTSGPRPDFPLSLGGVPAFWY